GRAASNAASGPASVSRVTPSSGARLTAERRLDGHQYRPHDRDIVARGRAGTETREGERGAYVSRASRRPSRERISARRPSSEATLTCAPRRSWRIRTTAPCTRPAADGGRPSPATLACSPRPAVSAPRMSLARRELRAALAVRDALVRTRVRAPGARDG